jgi:hypothetical protein
LKKINASYRALKKKVKEMLQIQEDQFSSSKSIMLMLKNYEERHYGFVTDRPED